MLSLRLKVLGPQHLKPNVRCNNKNFTRISFLNEGDDFPRHHCQGIIIVPSEILKMKIHMIMTKYL